MNRLTLTAAGIASVAMAGAATGDLVNLDFDITGSGWNTSITHFAGVSSADYANALIVSWGFSGVSADVYWNSGASYSNWASEARLGIYDMDTNDGQGDVFIWAASPFAGINTGGDSPGGFTNYAGADFSSGDVSGNGFHIGSEGDIGAAGYTTWGDGSGMDAGVYTSGTVWVTIDTIPAPGALALLGLAGVAGLGRRRR